MIRISSLPLLLNLLDRLLKIFQINFQRNSRLISYAIIQNGCLNRFVQWHGMEISHHSNNRKWLCPPPIFIRCPTISAGFVNPVNCFIGLCQWIFDISANYFRSKVLKKLGCVKTRLLSSTNFFGSPYFWGIVIKLPLPRKEVNTTSSASGKSPLNASHKTGGTPEE